MSEHPDRAIPSPRPYEPQDRDACLALFDGNVPRFFALSERADFARFLERLRSDGTYLVLEREGRVVACGGLGVSADGAMGELCWGMVDRTCHGQGLGRALTEARLRVAATKPGLRRIRLDTSQHTQGFYARFGFRTLSVTPDGYGPGLDRWDMILEF